MTAQVVVCREWRARQVFLGPWWLSFVCAACGCRSEVRQDPDRQDWARCPACRVVNRFARHSERTLRL